MTDNQRKRPRDSGKTTELSDDLLKRAKEMWGEVSNNCVVEQIEGDEWNYRLKWRDMEVALLTQMENDVAVTFKVDINPATLRLNDAIIQLSEDRGKEKFGKFCGEVSFSESTLRLWPSVKRDEGGNYICGDGKGEYARVLCTMSEIKYTIITQYKPGTKDGRWQYVDSRKFSEYTHTILNLFKRNEDNREKRSLDALMEL